MTEQNQIINGDDHAKFDLEWAKRGGVLICADPESTKKLFKFVRNIDLEKIEVTVLGWLDGCPVTNFWESKTIFRMATPKEAGVEYIKRPVSDQSLSDLQQRAQAALRYAEKLRGIFHVSMLKAYPQKTHQEISDEIDNAMKEVK